MSRKKWIAVAGYVRTDLLEARKDADFLRARRPDCQVRTYQRGVRAGGFTFTVFCAVARKPYVAGSK